MVVTSRTFVAEPFSDTISDGYNSDDREVPVSTNKVTGCDYTARQERQFCIEVLKYADHHWDNVREHKTDDGDSRDN